MQFIHEGHWFGLYPPKGTDLQWAWGARAILTGHAGEQYIDLMPDRQQAFPPSIPAPAAFRLWLDTRLSKWIANTLDERFINPLGAEVFTLDDGLCHAIASPNMSGGYLYIGAWMDAEPA